MLTNRQLVLWIACLSAAAMGIRNFEQGLSTDAPLYANIARNAVASGEWFRLDSGIPHFVPFAEHPHFFFWILGAVFKILPAADWSARVPGHLFYFGFLTLFAFYLRRLADLKTACWAVLLLWSWFRVSNFFSNVYPDPALLFFGFASTVLFDLALEKRKIALAALAGFSFGLCLLTKGFAAAGFAAPVVFLWILDLSARPTDWKRSLANAGTALLSAGAVFGAYALAIHFSSAPDFLQLYWDRQMTNRLAPAWQIGGLIHWRGWGAMGKDTYQLCWLMPLIFTRWKQAKRCWLPVVLFLSYSFLYASSQLMGTQYWLTVLPWTAWMIADGVFSRLPVSPRRLAIVTGSLSLLAIFLVQYIPVNTRRLQPPQIVPLVQAAAANAPERSPILEVPPHELNFLGASRLAWYTGLRIRYAHNLQELSPETRAETLYLFSHAEAAKLIKSRGYCPEATREGETLWIRCGS
ncbi:glycosyltransferase family 39 protein [bacterium]|nr:glycosyltransferase family 39 protein [bacterium]